MTMLPLLPQSLFALLLVWAAVGDVRRFTIPNWISVAAIVLFLAAAALAPQTPNLISHVGAGLVVLAVGLFLFARGMMGGGDVKLWAVCALWFGFADLPLQLMAVGIGGGILSGLLILVRALPQGAAADGAGTALPRVLRRGAPVPYGVAISAGTLFALAGSPVVHPWGL